MNNITFFSRDTGENTEKNSPLSESTRTVGYSTPLPSSHYSFSDH
jgi:hypothetical protein